MRISISAAIDPTIMNRISDRDLKPNEKQELNNLISKLGQKKILKEKSSGRLDFLLKKSGSAPFRLERGDRPHEFKLVMTEQVQEQPKLLTTPLHQAVATATLADVQTLLRDRPDFINARDERGKTPLAAAIESQTAKFSRVEIVSALIKAGADINLGDSDNWTPVYRACTNPRQDLLKLLVDESAKLDMQNSDGSTPLHRLSDWGSVEGVKLLLARGTTPNITNVQGTPLYYAAKNGNLPLAKSLIESNPSKDTDINLVNDPLDFTPLAIARNNNKLEMVEFLKLKGGVEEAPKRLHTKVQSLVLEGTEGEILESYKRNEVDAFGRNVSHYCAAFGRTDLLQKMDKEGLDKTDNLGRTPLHYAIMRDKRDVALWLIHKGKCDPLSQDAQGYFPLMWACQYSREGIAASLLETADSKEMQQKMLTQVDKFKWTAFQKAAHQGNLKIVQMFVEKYGVDPNQATPDGRTAYIRAELTGSVAVMEYLKPFAIPK